MSRTYSVAALGLNSPSSAAWALAWVRFALRDVPNATGAYPEGSLEDGELTAALLADAVTDLATLGGDGTVYYRPHRTAARLLKTDPSLRARVTGSGITQDGPRRGDIGTKILRANGWIDAAIRTASSKRVGNNQLWART